MMSKRERRVFIITLVINNNEWHYKKGDIIKSVVISNSDRNAYRSFEDHHCGSHYPSYTITDIEDTYYNDFLFKSNINSKNLL